ncbi:hypothetical protein Bca52824_045385 [Brassica carinata]|uniref:Protein kinase domain-containing protein n=1 Tax=Brassica carinata TaxID=52824 RepID=A0A8X7UQ65_BRACI|nr:hypothetical protein Bca52824_045385 [Brassica carinata]
MEWTRGRILGRGSTATVCAAMYRSSNEILAVKSSELHRSEFLQREAKILSSLNSPYVIRYRGTETKIESNGVVTYNLLMEYAPYGTLTVAAAKTGPTRGSYDREVHARDTTRLGVYSLERDRALRCKGEQRGCRGEGGGAWGETGSESDIWAAGCTVIEMATGSPPWTEASSREDPVSVLYRVGYSVEEEVVEEEEEAVELQDESRNLDRLNLLACYLERIGRLRCVGGLDGPRWDMEGGDWITKGLGVDISEDLQFREIDVVAC